MENSIYYFAYHYRSNKWISCVLYEDWCLHVWFFYVRQSSRCDGVVLTTFFYCWAVDH